MNDTAPVRRVLSFAKPGEVVPIRDEAGSIHPMMVFESCEQRQVFYCVDHELPLQNWGQLDMHIEKGGAHHFVRQCRVHGRPEAGTPADKDRLACHEQLESGL